MKRNLQGLGFATLLALTLISGPAHAQTSAVTRTSTLALRYDMTKEVTLSATVQTVPAKSSRGFTPTSGLVLQTTSGMVQCRLTQFTLTGKEGLSITAGEHVQVTGVMTTTMLNKQVFLIRTIQINGRTYAIRNDRGFPLEHPARNIVTTTESKGDQL